VVRGDRCQGCRKKPRDGRSLHGHHPDYRRPLWALWLCPTCHGRLHGESRWLRIHYKVVEGPGGFLAEARPLGTSEGSPPVAVHSPFDCESDAELRIIELQDEELELARAAWVLDPHPLPRVPTMGWPVHSYRANWQGAEPSRVELRHGARPFKVVGIESGHVYRSAASFISAERSLFQLRGRGRGRYVAA
jgi:hypothetical protein